MDFYENIDFLALEEYCYSSASEIVIPKTVRFEYLNFYRNEVLLKRTTEINRASEKLKRLEKLKNIQIPKFTNYIEEQIDFINQKLIENRLNPPLSNFISKEEITLFLLNNKQETKKDNTRDFIIWKDAIEIAYMYEDEQIAFISNDKIFTENMFLQNIYEKANLSNLKTYKSIASFLSKYGFQSDKLTKNFILKNIPQKKIEEILLKYKNDIPSYISSFYYESTKDFKLEKLKVNKIYVEEFYSHRDIESHNIKIIVHLAVSVLMIFEPEKKIEELNEYLGKREKKEEDSFPNTFDKQARPYFNDFILFYFGLEYDDTSSEISSMDFLDFFPNDSRFRHLKGTHDNL